MQKSFFYVCSFLLLLAPRLMAQNADVGIGQWRVHLPYNLGTSIAGSDKIVYCSSVSGLFSFTREDGALKRISRINGLSDFQIHQIRYSPALGVLVIAYANSNIDLLYDDGHIVNLSDIERKDINGNKSINDIYIKDHLAYLACGFGIVVLNLDKQEVMDTYYMGPSTTGLNVNGVTSDSTYLYAATDSGVYKALVDDPFIFYYTAWSKDQTIPGSGGQCTSICFFNNKVYTVNNDSLFQHDTSGWHPFNIPGNNALKVMTNGSHLVVRNSYSISAYDIYGNRTHYADTSSYANAKQVEAFVGSDNIMYIVDQKNGLVRDQGGSFDAVYPNGPSNIASVAMASGGDDIWVATGALTSLSSFNPAFSRDGLYHYSNNNWNSFDSTNTGLFKPSINNYTDVMDIKCDPNDSKHAFVAGWGGGLFEFRDTGFIKKYDGSNSPLVGASWGAIYVGSMNFDQNGNLWVVNTLSSADPIYALLPDGTWRSFFPKDPNTNNPVAYDLKYLSNLIVDQNGYKWFIINGNGVGVFYENDINNANVAQFKALNTTVGQGNLPTAGIHSLAVDQDNTIWVGSENGVAAFYSPQSVFDPTGFDCQQVLIQQGPYTQILLQNQTVTAIAVDGANQKWFGTQDGGVFLTSPDGTTQILNFNTSNSPILSNTINCIAINPLTGEVFFGTDEGICSYRGTATEGGDACDTYYVYPNPVKHDYGGLIAVRGLVANAHVKITDVTGNVVYETTATGGQATWSGNNYSGERAHTGVYIVYVSNDDGSATCVTKFLMVN